MAITSPALSLSIEALFGAIKPRLDILRQIGATDFAASAPTHEVKPGATIKVPLSGISEAAAYNADTNNYLTGGETTWASLTATHYLQGFDIAGVNIDEGVNAPRMRQLFSVRAGAGIAAAAMSNTAAALDGITASTAVTLAEAPTLEEYIALAGGLKWLNKATSCLVLNGAELAKVRAAAAAKNLAGDDAAIASYLGFGSLAYLPGMTARAVIAPETSVGFIARVPEVIARYQEVGIETDPESGLSIGIVVADDQAQNRQIVNADLWFGTAVVGANAAATTAGAIKIA